MLGEPGRRVIVEAEAEIVRRIFQQYVDGSTPRDIAHALNRDRVPPPRGRAWNASTINGNGLRGSGLLRNELFVGKLVWNKVRMVKDPDTGRRVSRPNLESEWKTAEVPELAIVSRDYSRLHKRRRQARSALIQASNAGLSNAVGVIAMRGLWGRHVNNGRDKSGRIRIRCSAATESGTCPDPKTFYLDTVEKAVLDGLTAELRRPEVIAEYVQHVPRGAEASRRRR